MRCICGCGNEADNGWETCRACDLEAYRKAEQNQEEEEPLYDPRFDGTVSIEPNDDLPF